MLDNDVKEQLKSVFADLGQTIELLVNQSQHEDQVSLVEMLEGLASTSDKIKVRFLDETTPSPQFHLATNGKANGIRFRGIPGGHEFSSLVLAILNSAGK
jgi:alkyl hydroperoxide reductase subunit F